MTCNHCKWPNETEMKPHITSKLCGIWHYQFQIFKTLLCKMYPKDGSRWQHFTFCSSQTGEEWNFFLILTTKYLHCIPRCVNISSSNQHSECEWNEPTRIIIKLFMLAIITWTLSITYVYFQNAAFHRPALSLKCHPSTL